MFLIRESILFLSPSSFSIIYHNLNSSLGIDRSTNRTTLEKSTLPINVRGVSNVWQELLQDVIEMCINIFTDSFWYNIAFFDTCWTRFWSVKTTVYGYYSRDIKIQNDWYYFPKNLISWSITNTLLIVRVIIIQTVIKIITNDYY